LILEIKDQQLWDPYVLPEEEVEDFLMKFQQLGTPGGLNTLPEGEHIKDNEQVSCQIYIYLKPLSLYIFHLIQSTFSRHFLLCFNAV